MSRANELLKLFEAVSYARLADQFQQSFRGPKFTYQSIEKFLDDHGVDLNKKYGNWTLLELVVAELVDRGLKFDTSVSSTYPIGQKIAKMVKDGSLLDILN